MTQSKVTWNNLYKNYLTTVDEDNPVYNFMLNKREKDYSTVIDVDSIEELKRTVGFADQSPYAMKYYLNNDCLDFKELMNTLSSPCCKGSLVKLVKDFKMSVDYIQFINMYCYNIPPTYC